METTDLITSFFSNEMNPEQERTFLLSVAASDSMRLGLKSHVMIDRILMKQADAIRVPEVLRQNIFAEAGVVAAMPQRIVQQHVVAPKGFFASRSLRVVSAALLFIGGAAAGYMVHPSDAQLVNVPTVAQPTTTSLVLSAPKAMPMATTESAPVVEQNAVETGTVPSEAVLAPRVRTTGSTLASSAVVGTDRRGEGDPRRANPLDPTKRFSRIPNPLNPTKGYTSKASNAASLRNDTNGSGILPSVNAKGDISKPDKKKNDTTQSQQRDIH